MKEDNIIQTKAFLFAIRIIRLYQYLHGKNEFIMSRQVLRSGTSIGANIEEALGVNSNKDFVARMTIVYKEARETKYWLKLLQETKYLTDKQAESLIKDGEEILKITGSIIKTLKKNQQNNV